MVTAELPREVSFVTVALQRLGGRGSLTGICRSVQELFPAWAAEAGGAARLGVAVRKVLEDYTPGSATWLPDRHPCFELVAPEEYRLIPPGRQPRR
ncbi:MAG TPA: hypothetical protein VMG41_00290 [Gemmatimonadales bacterium]|nr:hypothetical protein [Gemmatimonadales bacterium]